MIRVKVADTRNGPGGRVETITMAAVPRVGDSFHWNGDDTGFTVKAVMWVIDPRYDVHIRGW